jgi:AcrR family transcriptional regulator
MTEHTPNTRDARRLGLLNAAAEVLALKPGASLADIAAHAGIGKATLHRYFPSREELMLALGYRALELVEQTILSASPEEGSAPEALARIVEALIPLGDKVHFLLNEEVLETHPAFISAEEVANAPVLALLKRGQAEGSLRSDLSAEWMLHHINYALFATWHSVHKGFTARRDAPRWLLSLLLGGIAAR